MHRCILIRRPKKVREAARTKTFEETEKIIDYQNGYSLWTSTEHGKADIQRPDGTRGIVGVRIKSSKAKLIFSMSEIFNANLSLKDVSYKAMCFRWAIERMRLGFYKKRGTANHVCKS